MGGLSSASPPQLSSKISPQNVGLFSKIFQSKEWERSQDKYQLV